jgi:hypothetical protein
MVVSPRMRGLRGMTTMSERAYLYWFTRHMFANQGAIVDLGCWLGSTTIPMAMGLARASRPAAGSPCIYAYDNFVWRSWMEPGVLGTSLEGQYADGESFLEEFERRTEHWRHLIRACPQDLADARWQGGGIEFLLVDAMKSWELANAIISRFYSALMPGRSFLFHQDFAHWYTPWIHLTHYRLRHYFEVAYDVPRSSSVVFRSIERIPDELLTRHCAPGGFTVDEIHSAFDYSAGLVGRDKRPNVMAAKITCFLHARDLTLASTELERCRSQGLDFRSDLAIVEREVLAAAAT